MRASWWAQVYVKCPFFRGDSHHSIRCEGPFDGAGIYLTMPSAEEVRKHEEIFCAEAWEKCEICRMIRAAKYDDE